MAHILQPKAPNLTLPTIEYSEYDKFPKRFGAKNTVGEVKYKKGGKVKKAKCRDGIAIRGKTKGTIR